MHEGRFTAAGGTHQGDKFPTLNGKGDGAQGVDDVVAHLILFFETVYLDNQIVLQHRLLSNHFIASQQPV